MHNLLSKTQLDGWRITSELNDEQNELLNDYYECLIECDSMDQRECKRICKEILM